MSEPLMMSSFTIPRDASLDFTKQELKYFLEERGLKHSFDNQILNF